MKKINILSLLLVLTLAGWGCSDSSTSPDPDPDPNNNEASAEKNFVYDAMNYWYYWQADVPDLADDRFENDQAKQQFLMDYSDAEALYEDLQFSDDEFSFFIDDYEEYQEEQDGVFAALGFNYGFVYRSSQGNELLGYIRYVVPNSPAEDAGLERLQLFTKVDGTTITDQNFLDLLTDNSPHELTLAHLEDGNNGVTVVEDSSVNVASREVIEDPVHITKVIESNGAKIGYLMYNAFQSNSHQGLNDAFGELQSQGAEELVLDLRYNGGGAVITSQLLSSMISGLGCSDIFSEFAYNEKRSSENQEVYFLDEVPLENEDGDILASQREGQCDDFSNTIPINSLNLDKVYVLVSGSTASASEALINSLSTYIDVTVIGSKTVGKDEGSLVLHDAPAPYTNEEQANPDHKKAIQPIVLKIVNADGQDYPDGFEPEGYSPNANNGNGGCVQDGSDNCINEITVENLQNKPALGSMQEPLLARAITIITGTQPAKARQTTKSFGRSIEFQEVKPASSLRSPRPFRQGMYIEPFMMPSKSKN